MVAIVSMVIMMATAVPTIKIWIDVGHMLIKLQIE